MKTTSLYRTLYAMPKQCPCSKRPPMSLSKSTFNGPHGFVSNALHDQIAYPEWDSKSHQMAEPAILLLKAI